VNDRNVLIAGVPRSGTTLACELLNLVPDTVALDEPMKARSLAGRDQRGNQREDQREAVDAERRVLDKQLICDDIDRFLEMTRASIAESGTAFSKHVDGRVSGGKFSDQYDGELRVSLESKGKIVIDKPLTSDFLLVIKHTGAFTALLDALVERFRVYATVRNPLSILSSWQTVPFPGREGHHPVAEEIDHDLAGELAGIGDRLERQIHLVGWFFERCGDVLAPEQIIRYESIVETGGGALAPIAPGAAALDEPLESRNRAPVYDHAEMRRLGERLLETDGAYWNFYARESVVELLEA
jgi:hypothetical protein